MRPDPSDKWWNRKDLREDFESGLKSGERYGMRSSITEIEAWRDVPEANMRRSIPLHT